MTVKTRFAPSPTGLLHVGNARTAVITWLFTRNAGGKMLLRIDDTDAERSKEEYVAALQEDLRWLGLGWDEFARQKDRGAQYDAAVEKLKASGRLYPCYETPEELALKRKSLLGRGLPPIYDRAALKLAPEQKAKYEAEGRKPHWRFMMNHAPIVWNDLVRGEVRFEGRDISDPVLIREDGTPLYHICSVVDDIDFGITHIIRGEDHVSNTAFHLQMFEALGARPPACAHLPLLSGAEGEKLSKRKGSLSMQSLREEAEIEPMAVISLLARLGTADPVEPFASVAPLVSGFDFKRFSKGAPKFDEDELFRLNARILHDLPFPEVKDRLSALGLGGVDEAFWNAVRPNIEKLSDVAEWWHVAHGPVVPLIEDADFAKTAADLLPEGPWDGQTWEQWISAVKAKTQRKGKSLFMPLRCAITGKEHGPELKDLLPLIGRDRVLKRLTGAKTAASG